MILLKKRLVATLIIKDGIVVQSINFRKYLPVGKPEIAVEFLNSWGIDEIILLDITASKDHSRKNYDFVNRATRSCFVPITVGGGINSVDDIQALLGYGADKICLNSHALASPGFITEAAGIFGEQCIIVSVDVVGSKPGEYRVYDAAKGIILDLDPVQWAKEVEARGAGEIFLTSVARDGSKAGFDLSLIEEVSSSVKVPVIASGGAGNPGHILDVITKTKASAVSAANFFHFSEHSVIVTKAVVAKAQDSIRLNTHADYTASLLDDKFRLKKHPDLYLENLLFEKIGKEII